MAIALLTLQPIQHSRNANVESVNNGRWYWRTTMFSVIERLIRHKP